MSCTGDLILDFFFSFLFHAKTFRICVRKGAPEYALFQPSFVKKTNIPTHSKNMHIVQDSVHPSPSRPKSSKGGEDTDKGQKISSK